MPKVQKGSVNLDDIVPFDDEKQLMSRAAKRNQEVEERRNRRSR